VALGVVAGGAEGERAAGGSCTTPLL